MRRRITQEILPVAAERAHYFDAGVHPETRRDCRSASTALYKRSHSTLDDGQFGQTLILSSFNYARGETSTAAN